MSTEDTSWQGEHQTPPAPPVSEPTDAEPTVEELQARIRELEARPVVAADQPLEAAPADSIKPVDAKTSTPAPRPTEALPVVPAPPVDIAAQQVAEHAIAPGSAGLAVRELAQLLETLGHETYISRGDNHDNVFTDALLTQVKRELTEFHKETADTDELPQLLRDVALIGEVTGETWLLLRDRAAKAEAAARA